MRSILFILCFLAIQLSAFAQVPQVFYDDFKNNANNWLIAHNNELVSAFTPKGYTLNNKGESNEIAYHQSPMDMSQAYTLETTITRDFLKENYGFGLVFGGNGPVVSITSLSKSPAPTPFINLKILNTKKSLSGLHPLLSSIPSVLPIF
jgi:hypothetical protein